jgi:type I restriction enzyme, S subunit
VLQSEDMVSKEGAAAGRLLPSHTLLVTCIGNLGKSALTASPSICNQQINAVLPTPAAEPEYLYYWSRTIRPWLEENSSATTVSIINKGRFSEAPIRIAPLAEQRRIVAKIDSLSGKSKRAHDYLDHVPRLVERYKQAILAAAFRGALTAKWREARSAGLDSVGIREQVQAERDSMRTKVGLRAKGRNRSFPAAVVDLPKLPSGWGWLTFDDCSWDLTVGHVGPMKDRYVKHGISFLRSLNVRANYVDLNKVVYIDEKFHRELAKSRLAPGDLVVVRTGEPGVAAVVPPQLKTAKSPSGDFIKDCIAFVT